MKNIPNIVTISELSRLIGISRPTLYKYVDEYAANSEELEEEFRKLFDFIDSENTFNKIQIYDYINKNFKSSSDALIDKIKLAIVDNQELTETLNYIVDNHDKLDLKNLKTLIEK